jgi:hypothetical protein
MMQDADKHHRFLLNCISDAVKSIDTLPTNNLELKTIEEQIYQFTYGTDTIFQQPGTAFGAFVGMILGFVLGFYPSISGGFMLIGFITKTFPALNPDIAYCAGLLFSCIAQTICYFLGFALGALIGYKLGEWFAMATQTKKHNVIEKQQFIQKSKNITF